MAEFVIKDTRVLIDGYDFSGKMSELNLTNQAELVDATVFGSSARKKKPGLKNTEMRVTSFFTATTDPSLSLDKQMQARVGSTNVVVSAIPDGTSPGNVSFTGKFIESEYVPGGSIGEMFMANFVAMGDGWLTRGKLSVYSSAFNSSHDSDVAAGIVELEPTSSGMSLTLAVHVIGLSSAGHEINLQVERCSDSGFAAVSTAFVQAVTTANVGSGIMATTIAMKSTMTWHRIIPIVSAGTSGLTKGYKLAACLSVQ